MIIGTGIDITDITRIALMLRRDNFLKKIYRAGIFKIQKNERSERRWNICRKGGLL